MHTEKEKIQELRALARECQNYQMERGWSDAQMCREIAQLGSTKTYKRILDENDPLDELNVDKQSIAYRGAMDLIEIRRKNDLPAEPEYQDFTNITESMAAVSRALREESVARFVVIEGENGTGKDAVKNALLKRWGKIIIATEADEFWRESLAVPLAAMIKEVSRVRDQKLVLQPYPAQRMETLIDAIGETKLVLLINEGHHLGPRSLNLIKTLINRTKLVVVQMCIPKLLNRLVASAYEEAIQLFGNRLCERVRLPAPPADEILTLMDRRGIKIENTQTANTVARTLSEQSGCYGNWRFVIQVTREARELAAGRPLDLALFSSALNKVRAKRVANQVKN